MCKKQVYLHSSYVPEPFVFVIIQRVFWETHQFFRSLISLDLCSLFVCFFLIMQHVKKKASVGWFCVGHCQLESMHHFPQAYCIKAANIELKSLHCFWLEELKDFSFKSCNILENISIVMRAQRYCRWLPTVCTAICGIASYFIEK